MLLDRQTYLVKERVAFVKLTDTYDIFDPASGQQIGVAKEEPHPLAKYFRLIISKSLMPTTINVYEQEGAPPVLSIRRGVALFRPKVHVAVRGQEAGHFQAKALSLGGAFRIFDRQQNEVAAIKGDWKGWNFTMTSSDGRALGSVTKKWAGLGKELFTSADNYMIDLDPKAAGSKGLAPLLLAAGLAIDTVFKEKQ